MPRTKLTGKDRDNFIKAKIWWATGDAGIALMQAINLANKYMSIEIREKAKNAIKGRSRPDNMPFPRDQLAKTTGQFTVGSTARRNIKGPPKYYTKRSLHRITWAELKNYRVGSFENSKGKRYFKISGYIVGPNKGGQGPNPKYSSGGKTIARKVEFGGTQMRRWRRVPAIKQRGKRGATWDMEWRTEFAGMKGQPPQDKPAVKQLRYIMMAEKGWIPWKTLANGEKNYNAYHEIPWQKGQFKAPTKSYMGLGLKRAMKGRSDALKKAKKAFPDFARKFVKHSPSKGYYI